MNSPPSFDFSPPQEQPYSSTIQTLRRSLRTDKGLPDVLGVDIGVLAELDVDLLVEGVDEEI